MTDRSYAVLGVASLPPPITGQSVAADVLAKYLAFEGVEHEIVDLSRPFYAGSRYLAAARRAIQVASYPIRAERARRTCRHSPIFYLQLGQSTQAMLRDLPLLAWARRHRLPTVVHVHGAGFRRAFDAAPRLIRWPLGKLLGSVSAAIVLTPTLAPMFRGLVDSERVFVVGNGPDAELTAAAERFERGFERDPGDSALTILYLSNLMDQKGYRAVLEAAALANRRGLQHRFVFAGAKTQMGSLDIEAYLREHNLSNVTFLGPVHGLAKLDALREADAFILPTYHPDEGQPISIIEAMQFGLPIITTRQGGIVDLVVDDESGIFVPPRDPEAILAAIERLSDRRRIERVSKAAREQGLQHTAAEHGRRMLDVFDLAAR